MTGISRLLWIYGVPAALVNVILFVLAMKRKRERQREYRELTQKQLERFIEHSHFVIG